MMIVIIIIVIIEIEIIEIVIIKICFGISLQIDYFSAVVKASMMAVMKAAMMVDQ